MGSNPQAGFTNLQSERVAQAEAPGFELARSARSYSGGLTAATNCIVPVVDLPTVLGPMVLFNSQPAGQGNKVLVVKRVSAAFSGTTALVEGAAGFGIFAGVTPSVLATPLVANGTGIKVQATRGYGTSVAFIDVAKTIPAGTAWFHCGGQVTLAAAALAGAGYTHDLSSHPFIVPPLFALTVGVLAGLGTNATYFITIGWDEVESTLV